MALVDEIEATKTRPSAWLEMVEREATTLMAMARIEAEDRKDRREKEKASETAED
jgi:hypothetical protein